MEGLKVEDVIGFSHFAGLDGAPGLFQHFVIISGFVKLAINCVD
jgi:hypothetical protein